MKYRKVKGGGLLLLQLITSLITISYISNTSLANGDIGKKIKIEKTTENLKRYLLIN